MKADKLADISRKNEALLRQLCRNVPRHPAAAPAISVPAASDPLLLLTMAEGLIAAHKAAKLDGDGYTLDLIETALQQVGRRLATEV